MEKEEKEGNGERALQTYLDKYHTSPNTRQMHSVEGVGWGG